MAFDLHIHRNSKQLREIISRLIKIETEMAKTKQEWKDLAVEFRGIFINIANDITRLTDQLQREDLTEAEEEEIFTEFRTLANEARTIAEKTPEQPQPGS